MNTFFRIIKMANGKKKKKRRRRHMFSWLYNPKLTKEITLRILTQNRLCACSVTQWYLTLCSPMDCSLPPSFVHVNFQARILQWVAISCSRGSSPGPGIKLASFVPPVLAGRFFITSPTWEATK